MATICSICNEKASLNRFKLSDGWICIKCFKECGFTILTPIMSLSSNDVMTTLQNNTKNSDSLSTLNITKQIGNVFAFDESKQKWWLIQRNKKAIPRIYDFADIIDFELLEDGSSIAKGGLGSAVVGGVLLGGAGAVVGAIAGGKKSEQTCTSLKIKITVNDFKNPAEYINFVEMETKKSGFLYKAVYNTAQECMSTLQLIVDRVKQTVAEAPQQIAISNVDEITKYKTLLDNGAITKAEFDAKKKQLLEL